MATIVEQRAQPMAAPNYEYDHMRLPGPQFTNPWGAPQSGSQHLYNPQQQTAPPTDPYSSRPPQYPSLAAPSALGSAVSHPADYTSTAASVAPSYTATATASEHRYPADHYSSSYNAYESRYPSYAAPQSSRAFRPSMAGRDSFSDAIDAGQGMVAMSQQDFTTPRAAYPARNGSTDSYGFPNTHSDHGSISSGSSYPYYGSYSGSADGSVASSSATDYSSASEDVGQRTLPPPGQLINGYPPDATQMMTQFNSKLAASAQKKHKCKICDKRFTRPSSLQTHMYSHTGEKPFACDFDGCGRHFSVVSNLRRHKKCHKGEGSIDSTSPEA